jgi:hypothetical protein
MMLSLSIFYAHHRMALMRFFIVLALMPSAFHCCTTPSTRTRMILCQSSMALPVAIKKNISERQIFR